MATNNNLSDNLNFLAPNGFRLTISREKFANTEFFVTQFSLPTLNLGETQVNFRNAVGYVSGDTVTFDPITLRIAIDETMANYTEINKWIIDNETKIEKHDMILSILSSHNNENKQIQFTNAFPTSLSGVEFNTATTGVEYLQTDITFRYDRFKIIT